MPTSGSTCSRASSIGRPPGCDADSSGEERRRSAADSGVCRRVWKSDSRKTIARRRITSFTNSSARTVPRRCGFKAKYLAHQLEHVSPTFARRHVEFDLVSEENQPDFHFVAIMHRGKGHTWRFRPPDHIFALCARTESRRSAHVDHEGQCELAFLHIFFDEWASGSEPSRSSRWSTSSPGAYSRTASKFIRGL